MKEFKKVEDKGHIGMYDDATVLVTPQGKPVTVDNPLAEEIQFIWSLGIETTGCCSGHNVYPSYIGVYTEYIPQMVALWYEVQINTAGKDNWGRYDTFFSKSVKTTLEMKSNYIESILKSLW